MFPVIGIFGFLFCFFRYKFVWRVVPIVVLICILYLFKLGELHPLSEVPVRSIVLSMFFATALPVAGALIGFERRKTARSDTSS